MALRIIVDNPADGGVKGHLCRTCTRGVQRSGPGWESSFCAYFEKPLTREVNSCTEYRSKDLNKYDPPNKILALAFSLVKRNGKSYFLNPDQYESWGNLYRDNEKLANLIAWGLEAPETAPEGEGE